MSAGAAIGLIAWVLGQRQIVTDPSAQIRDEVVRTENSGAGKVTSITSVPTSYPRESYPNRNYQNYSNTDNDAMIQRDGSPVLS